MKGENKMQQVDTNQLLPKLSTVINSLLHYFGNSRISTAQPDRFITNIDWPDADPEESSCGNDNRPVSGGYNEAFIVQHWTSYHLQ
jgi:hypothetical protein